VRDVIVQDTRSRENDLGGGRGLNFQSGAEVVVERALVRNNRDTGVFAINPGTTLTMNDVIVQDTRSQESDLSFGRGLSCRDGAEVVVERGFFGHNREMGVIALDPETKLRMTDVVIQDTQSRESDLTGGRGLGCQDGAEVTVERALLDHNRDIGVAVINAGTKLTMKDVAVQDTQSRESDQLFGRGLDCEEGSEVTVERGFFDHNHDVGVLAVQPGTKLMMTDVVVQDTRSQESDLGFGNGLESQYGAEVVVKRGFFDRNRDTGVGARHPGTRLTLADVVVQDTQSRASDLRFGRGLQCQEGAEVVVDRAEFDRNREVGVFASQPATKLTMRDVIIQDTLNNENDLAYGLGLVCQYGAEVTVERALVDRNRDIGVVASQPGTTLTMTDVVVQNTRSGELYDEYGVGVAVAVQASLTMNRSRLRSNRVAALLVLPSSSASLSACSFLDTLPGNFTPVDEEGQPLDAPIKGVGDGLIALAGSSVSGSDLLFSGMNRAGLLFVDSTGTLTTTTSTKNQYGMVLRGSSQPTYDETCSFEGNETPILPGGDLPVPNAPLQTPPVLD
jgi:hypothetical protein